MHHSAAGLRRYFSNATLYNRDRPVFKKYVPILRAINRAGWQPVTNARVVNGALSIGAAGADRGGGVVFVERWGELTLTPSTLSVSQGGDQFHQQQQQQQQQRQRRRQSKPQGHGKLYVPVWIMGPAEKQLSLKRLNCNRL